MNVNKLRRQELHENERPISLMMSHQAEMNRDKKKRKKPFSLEEFYIYRDLEEEDKIDPIYGAASQELIKNKQFPSWALFVYKELMQQADQASPPEVLCYQHPDAIVLAPVLADGSCRGMLIAKEAASDKLLEMRSPCGKMIKIKMPSIRNKFIAEENCYLDYLS